VRLEAERSEQLATRSTERLVPSDSVIHVLSFDRSTLVLKAARIYTKHEQPVANVSDIGFVNAEVLHYPEIPDHMTVARPPAVASFSLVVAGLAQNEAQPAWFSFSQLRGELREKLSYASRTILTAGLRPAGVET